jgi:spermidine synthase
MTKHFKIPAYLANQVLFDGATEFEHYTIVDTNYNKRPARVLYTDNESAAQSGLPFDGKPEPLFDYNERFMELVNGLKPKQALLIGGGAFTLPITIGKECPEVALDVYEIDGALVKLAAKYFGFSENGQIKSFVGDGRELLRSGTKKYDLIMLDVFNSIDVPESFLVPELARELMNRLNPDGIIAMNIIGAYHGERAKILKRLTESLETVFPRTEIYPAGSVLSLWMSQNFIVVAGNNVDQATKHISYQPVR